MLRRGVPVRREWLVLESVSFDFDEVRLLFGRVALGNELGTARLASANGWRSRNVHRVRSRAEWRSL